MSCPHVWKKVNDVHVCIRCGLTRIDDGQVIFDRELPNYKRKQVKKNAKQK